jgi:hypothetical protein
MTASKVEKVVYPNQTELRTAFQVCRPRQVGFLFFIAFLRVP